MEFGLICMLSTGKNYKDFKISSFSKLDKITQQENYNILVDNNIKKLLEHIQYCSKNDIKSFRVTSELFPKLDWVRKNGLKTPYNKDTIEKIKKVTFENGIVLSLHPSQVVNMGSPREEVIESSVANLNSHIWVAELLGIEEINIHLGGAYGDKCSAKKRFCDNMRKNFKELSRFTIENDENCFGVEDCFEVSQELNIRVVFDVHHHRCYSTRFETCSVTDGFELAQRTWKGYNHQRVHISSPKTNYTDTLRNMRSHHDYIDINDFPEEFLGENVHIDVEAKMKEQSISKLRNELLSQKGLK